MRPLHLCLLIYSFCSVTLPVIIITLYTTPENCRCGIPVVLMGETGCGKTRLIRFMCDLALQNAGRKNMLILKVTRGMLLLCSYTS